MEQQPTDKPTLSNRQKDAIARANIERAEIASLLLDVITNGINGRKLCERIRTQQRSKKRNVPLCWITPPVIPKVMYVSVPPESCWYYDYTFYNERMTAVSCSEFLDTSLFAYACVEFDVVFNFASLMEFLLTHTRGAIQHKLKEVHSSRPETYWYSCWYIEPKHQFTVCDIAAVPNPSWLDELADPIRMHISRLDLQPFFDECNKNGKPSPADRFPI